MDKKKGPREPRGATNYLLFDRPPPLLSIVPPRSVFPFSVFYLAPPPPSPPGPSDIGEKPLSLTLSLL